MSLLVFDHLAESVGRGAAAAVLLTTAAAPYLDEQQLDAVRGAALDRALESLRSDIFDRFDARRILALVDRLEQIATISFEQQCIQRADGARAGTP